MLIPAIGGALLLLAQDPAVPPRRIVADALRAVEGDSVDAVKRRWSRAVPDRAALLGLGALRRLTYDYVMSDSALDRVVALESDDALADYARLEKATSLVTRGRFNDAAVIYEQTLTSAERRADTTAMAEALLGLAVPRSRSAPPTDVVALLDRAARLNRGDAARESNQLCQRASLFARFGRPEAAAFIDSGEKLAARAGDKRQRARCIHVRAQMFAGRGFIDRAASELVKARPLFEQSRDHASLAAILQWRGYLWLTLGHPGLARHELTAAIAEGERAQAPSPIGWSLISLGLISLELGDRATATEQLTRARTLLEQQGDAWGAITARGALGGVARAAGDTAKARAEYSEVLAWGERTGNVQLQRNMHDALSSLAEMAHDWRTAERELAFAREISVKAKATGWLDGQFFRDGRLALRRGNFASAEKALQRQLTLLDSSQHSLRYTVRALLAEVYAKTGALPKAEAELVSASEEVDRWRGQLSEHDLRARYLEFSNGLDPDLGVATVIATLARAGRVEPAFALAESRRARELTDQIARAKSAESLSTVQPRAARKAASLAEARQLLPDEATALLEYVTGRGGEPSTLFIVTRNAIESRALPAIDSLAADINRLTTVIEAGGNVKPLAEKLGGVLLQPALTALGQQVTKLLVVPDGMLARVPFDALRIDGRFAIERFTIGLLPSATTLLALKQRGIREQPVRILAFGDPAFDLDSTHITDPSTTIYRSAFTAKGGGGLARLAASGFEVENVARYAPNAVVRKGSGASEAFLRKAPLDSFRILHFATHALVDDEAVTRTALALAPGDGEDGFLGPGDLSALDLNADLVVLSACRTAGGVVVAGEGVQGLTAPLLQAGARSVIATQWRIADSSAGELVDGVYRALAAGHPLGDALRAAKLSALKAGVAPSEWAAFVVVGDPSVRIPLLATNRFPFASAWVVAALGALVGLYGWMRKRRGAVAA